jgi:hypothetical protein
MVLVLTLTEHCDERENKHQIELEEDLASKSVDFIAERHVSVCKSEGMFCRILSDRMVATFLSN